jgi:hypothetical protein
MTYLNFNYPADSFQSFLDQIDSLNDFLRKVLFNNSVNKSRIADQLLAYHTTEGGFPEIVDLDIAESQYDFDLNKGKLPLKYTLGYSNTCAGTRVDLQKTEKINFEIDSISNSIILSFINIDVRSTSDEF